jgi:hypothetical protein
MFVFEGAIRYAIVSSVKLIKIQIKRAIYYVL